MDEIQLLKDRISALEEKANFPSIDFFNVRGRIRTVTSAPTTTPTKPADQILLYVDSLSSPSTKRLYIYSSDVPAWYYVALT